jgi:hypothetical protein
MTSVRIGELVKNKSGFFHHEAEVFLSTQSVAATHDAELCIQERC